MRPLNFLSFTPTFYSLYPSLIVLFFPSSHSYVDSRAIPFFINWRTLKSHINSIQPHVYMHFDYGGIFGRRVWRRAEKQGGRNIVYCRREDRVRKSSSDVCLLQFSLMIRCYRREKKNLLRSCRFLSIRESIQFERLTVTIQSCATWEDNKIIPNKINRFRRNGQTDELGKFAVVQWISGSCLTRTSLGCPLRLRNVNAATQITRRAATLRKFAAGGG